MVDLKKELTKVDAETRIKILQRIKKLEEEKLKKIQEKKEKEIKEIEKKTKNLEKELDEQIKDSIGDLTANIEQEELITQKRKDFLEQRIQELNNKPESIEYKAIINQINSNNENDLKDAYNEIKEILYSNSNIEEKMFDYTTIKKIKTAVERSNEIKTADPIKGRDISKDYKQRMKTILDQAFNNVRKYE
jgi:hypothetical protein